MSDICSQVSVSVSVRQSVSVSASPGMADFVSEAKVLQCQNAFFHFACEKTGVLRARQMGEVMR